MTDISHSQRIKPGHIKPALETSEAGFAESASILIPGRET